MYFPCYLFLTFFYFIYSDMLHSPKHYDSFGQESMYLKYCPRDDQVSEYSLFF